MQNDGNGYRPSDRRLHLTVIGNCHHFAPTMREAGFLQCPSLGENRSLPLAPNLPNVIMFAQRLAEQIAHFPEWAFLCIKGSCDVV